MNGNFETIRIIIADDHPVVRKGLRIAIEEDGHLQVVAEAADGEMAMRQMAALAPDIAVLDIDMPKLDGLAAMQQMKAQGIAARALILTMHDGEDLYQQAMDLGARGYLLKESAMSEIVTAIRSVHAGDLYLTPQMSLHLQRQRGRERKAPGLADLTPTERRIMAMINANKSSKEIAAELGINFRTVENRRTAICEKLNLHGTHALVKFALDHRRDMGD